MKRKTLENVIDSREVPNATECSSSSSSTTTTTTTSNDNNIEIARELLLAGTPLERVIELFRETALDDDCILSIARDVFSKTISTQQTRTASLAQLGKSILEYSPSSDSHSNFLKDYTSYIVNDIPEDFLDPIYYTMMSDPVVLSSGFICDRTTVLDEHSSLKFTTCPYTREELREDVYPAKSLQQKIGIHVEEKLRPLLDIAARWIASDQLHEFSRVQTAAKDFLSRLGQATYANYEREIAELHLTAWKKAGEQQQQLSWSPQTLAESVVGLYKGTPELHRKNSSKVLTTPDHYDYSFLEEPLVFTNNELILTFEVKANANAHIGFVENPKDLTGKMYEIAIGTCGGSTCCIREDYCQEDHLVANTQGPKPLDGSKFQSFWIRIVTISSEERVISAGRGKTPGFHSIVATKIKNLDVQRVGFSTGWGSSGIWKNIQQLQTQQQPRQSAPTQAILDFQGRISFLEQRAREAISMNQLDVASEWCDACDLVNQSCGDSVPKFPVHQIRLDIERKRGEENMEYARLSAYNEIKHSKDPNLLRTFCDTEGIDPVEYESKIANIPVGVSAKAGWFVDSVTFTYADGGNESYGGIGGDEKPHMRLEVGEKIVLVEGFQLETPEYLGTYIKFTTNHNRKLLVNGNGSCARAVDPEFSIPDGKEIHRIQNPAGYYYRFECKDGIFGLDVKGMGMGLATDSTVKIQGVMNLEERMARKRLRDGEYKITNANGGVLFCSNNVSCEENIWPFVAPNHGCSTKSQESWYIQQQQNGLYTIRNRKYGSLFFCGKGSSYGPTEADNDGSRYTWVNPKESGGNENAEWKLIEQTDGTYKIFNVKWNGPLFAHSRQTADGYHYPRTHLNHDYEDEAKERWELKLISPMPLPLREDIVISSSASRVDEEGNFIYEDSDDDDY